MGHNFNHPTNFTCKLTTNVPVDIACFYSLTVRLQGRHNVFFLHQVSLQQMHWIWESISSAESNHSLSSPKANADADLNHSSSFDLWMVSLISVISQLKGARTKIQSANEKTPVNMKKAFESTEREQMFLRIAAEVWIRVTFSLLSLRRRGREKNNIRCRLETFAVSQVEVMVRRTELGDPLTSTWPKPIN